MNLENFKAETKRLATNLGKKLLMDDAAILYREVSFIPDAAWLDIVQEAIDKWDNWPRNFPKAIKALWHTYQASNATTPEGEDCNYCHQDGHLLFYDKESGNRTTCACGHCANWKRYFGSQVPRWTVEQIRENGHTPTCCNYVPYCDHEPQPGETE